MFNSEAKNWKGGRVGEGPPRCGARALGTEVGGSGLIPRAAPARRAGARRSVNHRLKESLMGTRAFLLVQ